MGCYRKLLALSTTKCKEEPWFITPIGVTKTKIGQAVAGLADHVNEEARENELSSD
jgi:hypothetical protein